MTNQEVIKKFLNREEGATPKRQVTNGYCSYEGRTLHTERVAYTTILQLYNYNTIISQISDNFISIDLRRYSSTTSKIQSILKREVKKMLENTKKQVRLQVITETEVSESCEGGKLWQKLNIG